MDPDLVKTILTVSAVMFLSVGEVAPPTATGGNDQRGWGCENSKSRARRWTSQLKGNYDARNSATPCRTTYGNVRIVRETAPRTYHADIGAREKGAGTKYAGGISP